MRAIIEEFQVGSVIFLFSNGKILKIIAILLPRNDQIKYNGIENLAEEIKIKKKWTSVDIVCSTLTSSYLPKQRRMYTYLH